MPLRFDPTGDPASRWGVACPRILKENILLRHTIRPMGRRSSLDRLRQIREKRTAVLLRSTLERTPARFAPIRLLDAD